MKSKKSNSKPARNLTRNIILFLAIFVIVTPLVYLFAYKLMLPGSNLFVKFENQKASNSIENEFNILGLSQNLKFITQSSVDACGVIKYKIAVPNHFYKCHLTTTRVYGFNSDLKIEYDAIKKNLLEHGWRSNSEYFENIESELIEGDYNKDNYRLSITGGESSDSTTIRRIIANQYFTNYFSRTYFKENNLINKNTLTDSIDKYILSISITEKYH